MKTENNIHSFVVRDDIR